ncbi:MAG: RnfABCDGE type electron transport complex subunit B, partial [Phycisphaerales bacterium]|nr:RnfABCDGE type electron transport complex subunit B [Phycisphaerales bacterium]
MGGLGAFFGLVLAVANRFLKVEEDPRIDAVEEMLPGTNCGACGQPGCRAFAEALVGGSEKPSGCTVSSPEGIEDIADFLGVAAGERVKLVARLHCAGGLGRAREMADYEGFESCRAAALVAGGGKKCSWGCLGLADCSVVCDFDAIRMNDDRLPVVDPDLCTACGDCVDICPKDLFDLMPIDEHLIVQCSAPVAAEEARALCKVACDACGRCAQDAEPGLITMKGNLPVIDRNSGARETADATARCPTGAIAWVTGEQFAGRRFVPLTISDDPFDRGYEAGLEAGQQTRHGSRKARS